MYGGFARITVRGAWNGTSTWDVADRQVQCQWHSGEVQWKVGGQLLGEYPAAARDGLSVEISEWHSLRNDPAKVTKTLLSLSIEDAQGTSHEGYAVYPDAIRSDRRSLITKVSRDRRQLSATAFMVAHPTIMGTRDDRIGWITVTVQISCDGKPPLGF
ncbi:hypothetical protein AB0B66_18860 [Catellatospora sp. NPDC049111]|uniref:hypothetical protein n=1 Tax=Catellatospora sp. NPDC049111 TaxID=3155271 RepID=UPI0034043FE0